MGQRLLTATEKVCRVR